MPANTPKPVYEYDARLVVPAGRHWRRVPEKGEAQARIPAPGLLLFSGATNPGQGMSHHVCHTWLPPPEPPASTCTCRHPPYTCPRASAPLPSSTHKHDIFDCAFSSMHVRQRQGTRHVYSYSRVGFDEASHCSYTIIAGKLVVLLLVGF